MRLPMRPSTRKTLARELRFARDLPLAVAAAVFIGVLGCLSYVGQALTSVWDDAKSGR